MKIYVFGVGEGKDIAQSCFRKDRVKVCGYIDNNVKLQEQILDGKKIVSLENADRHIMILISIQKYEEVYQQLIQAGVEKRKIMCFYSVKSMADRRFWHIISMKKWRKEIFRYYWGKFNPHISPFDFAVRRWFKEEGDSTYRLDYDLNEDSCVFDLGGYHGDFTKSIVDKFHCHVWVFEPVPEYADLIQKKFHNNPKVKVFCMGLAEKDSHEVLYLGEDGSSVFRKSRKGRIKIRYCEITKFMKEHNIRNIDLMKINIEGGEYSLIEHLLDTKMISNIVNIQVQFHNLPKIHSSRRMHKIWKRLKKTHRLTWKFRPYVWENWKKRG